MHRYMGCPICDVGVIELQSWGGGYCVQCGSIACGRLPSQFFLKNYYQEFNKTYKGGGRARNLERYGSRYLEIVRKFSDGRKLIDISSSTNPFPELAAAAGYDITVADYVESFRLPSRSILHMIDLDQPATIPKQLLGCFDVVTCFAVLEHCRYPQVAFRSLSTLCRKNGVIVLTTPAIDVQGEKYSYGRNPWFHPPSHLHIISRKGFLCLAKKCRCVLVHDALFELNPVRWLLRYGCIFAERSVGLVIKALAPKCWVALRASTLAFGKGIRVCVFKKGA